MKGAGPERYLDYAGRVLRRRLRFAKWLVLGEQQAMLLWAGGAGILAGLVSAGFLKVLRVVQSFFTMQSGDIVADFRNMPAWQRLLTPAIGGLLAGFCLLFARRLARGKKSTDYLEAIALGDGRLPLRISVGKAIAAVCSVGSGGSIGREGALVQLAALAASRMGVLSGLNAPRLRVLVAAGTAGGVAAAYHAPIAGSLFVAEIVLGSLAMESFGPLVVAAVASTLVARQLNEATPLYLTKGLSMGLVSWWEVGPVILLGILAGGGAWLCQTLFKRLELIFEKLLTPLAVRMAVGGLLVGLVAIWWPEVCGNGQSVIGSILQGEFPWRALVWLLLMKLLATGITTGSGAVGGVLTPTLFLGAALGGVAGQLLHGANAVLTAPPGAYAIAGMAALLSAMTHAPLVSVVLVFELTLDYDLMAPVMLAAVSAYATASALGVESVYARSLRNKRETEPAPEPARLTVRDLLKPPPPCVDASASLADVAGLFMSTRRLNLAVTNSQGALTGLVNLHDIKEYLNNLEMGRLVTAEELAHPTPLVTPEMSLQSTLLAFAGFEGERLPVVDSAETRHLMGSIAKFDLLLALASGGAKPAQAQEPLPQA